MADAMTLGGSNPSIEARSAPNITGQEVQVPETGVQGGYTPSRTPSASELETTAEQNPTAIQPVVANYWESMGAGMGGIAITAYRAGRSALIYDRDPDFDHTEYSNEYFTTYGAGSPEEVKYLAAAKNEQDFNDRTEHITDDRLRRMAMVDNPISGAVGSIADLDVAVGAIKAVRLGNAVTKMERVTERAIGGAAGAAAMVGLNEAMGSTLRTDDEKIMDVVSMGLSRALAPMARSSNAATATIADNAIREIDAGTPSGTPAQQVAGNKWVAQIQSSADELNYYTQGDQSTVVNKLLSNPATNNGDDVVSAQNAYLNNYGTRTMQFEDSFKDALTEYTGIRSNAMNRITGKYSAAYQEFSADFQVTMQRLDDQVEQFYKQNGQLPTRQQYDDMLTDLTANLDVHKSDAMKKAAHSYIDSRLMETVYDDVKAAESFMKEVVDPVTGEIKLVNGMDDIIRRPTYMPLRHSYDKIEDTVLTRKVATMDEVADFVGTQIGRMYPELLNPKGKSKTFTLTTRQIGQHFLQTQRDSARSLSDVTATGMNREQIKNILTRTGHVNDSEAYGIADTMFKNMQHNGTSTPKNLRRRIDWDWNMSMRTSTGHNLSMRDLVDNNVMGNIEDYTRSMAHRNGLAAYGLKSETDLNNLLESYLSKLPEGTNIQKARQFMRNTHDTLMGRSIENNPLPEGVRTAQAVADVFLLANSGLYGMMDLATQMQKVGVLQSIAHFKEGLKPMFNSLKKFSPAEAKELEDILTGRLLQGSRWKNFQVRYADNFEVSAGIHEAAQYYGQSARFMNLSESLKRFQVGILSSVYVSNLKKAMLNDTKAVAFMKDKLKFSTDELVAIQKDYAKHGTKIDDWSNGTRVMFERKVYHDADNLAMNVHRGEVPAFIEHSAVGRVIFPYMRYAFGMQNKVLRRTLNRDGATGLAMLMALQIPTGMLIGAAINVRTGKEPDDNLETMTIKSMSSLGSLNYPLEIALGGLNGGGVTALAPLGKTYNFGKELFGGGADGSVSPRTLLQNSPINAAMPLHYLMLGLED